MALHTIPSLPPANQRPKHHRKEREQETGKDRADKKSTEMSADSWKRGRKETIEVNEKTKDTK